MESLGRHELIELYGCERRVLDDVDAIRRLMLEAAARARATIVTESFHRFRPHGVSGVIILAESHLAVHTWPEHGYAAVDLFSCSGSLDSDACLLHLRESLGSQHHERSVVRRGVRTELARHGRSGDGASAPSPRQEA